MLDRISVALAKRVMQLAPAEPVTGDLSLFEVFHLDSYRQGSDDERAALEINSARQRFEEEEKKSFFAQYFPGFDTSALRSRSVLDLGCFTGGRLIYWAEAYGIGDPVGIDINPLFAAAGTRFATQRAVNASFFVGVGENLPFDAERFDFVVSYDVFEHVQSVEQTLAECHRVLKPGGLLLVAFPQYHQPAEAHLGFVTRVPALQWFFSGRTLARALHEITTARGPRADWYARQRAELEPWEHSPGLNGTTAKGFKRIVSVRDRWRVVYWSTAPVFSGRRAKGGIYAAVAAALSIPARLPLLEELTLGRICCILQKAPSR
jgi:SAM-dependent methyltransferase